MVIIINTTADELEAAAALHEKNKSDSFDRCDTDGFLSQWADGITASQLRAQAQIERDGGIAEFVGLYDGDRRVIAKIVYGQYGASWMLDESEAAKYGRKFLPTERRVEVPTSKILKGLGLREAWETQPAYATLGGGGKGLAGAASVQVVINRKGGTWGREATLMPAKEWTYCNGCNETAPVAEIQKGKGYCKNCK